MNLSRVPHGSLSSFLYILKRLHTEQKSQLILNNEISSELSRPVDIDRSQSILEALQTRSIIENHAKPELRSMTYTVVSLMEST